MARKKGLEGNVSFRVADAHNLPFEDEIFDVVIVECTTGILDKERAFREFICVLKSGGYIGDLEIIWKKEPPEELVERVYKLWGGFRTMTLDGWRRFFRSQGLVEVKAVDFSDEIPRYGKGI